MKKADGGGVEHAKNAIRNERKEIQRVEAKSKDAGQEIKRVRSEMAYDKNVVKDGYCGGGKVKKADGGTVAPVEARKALMARAMQQRGQGMQQGRMGALGQMAQQSKRGAMRGRVQPTVATPTMKKGGTVKKAEGGQWIQEAISKPGALRKSLHVKAGETIPKAKLEKAAEKSGIMGKRARLAETLGKMHKADGGKVDAACKSEIRKDVHKHEQAMHPSKPLTKLAKGGFNSKPLVSKNK